MLYLPKKKGKQKPEQGFFASEIPFFSGQEASLPCTFVPRQGHRGQVDGMVSSIGKFLSFLPHLVTRNPGKDFCTALFSLHWFLPGENGHAPAPGRSNLFVKRHTGCFLQNPSCTACRPAGNAFERPFFSGTSTFVRQDRRICASSHTGTIIGPVLRSALPGRSCRWTRRDPSPCPARDSNSPCPAARP